jgi:hypothetical protein
MTHPEHGNNAAANARLIAAAPDLLAALEQYADPRSWGYIDGSGCVKGQGESEDACLIGPDIARAAIARAKGA